jgi:transposase-like protein
MNIIQIYKKFPTQKSCIEHIENKRWQNKAICPYCKSNRSTKIEKENRHHCNNCNTSFSATIGTIFHHTHLPLQKWFLAISLILNAKKGVSSRQLARDIEVNKNTAWRMQMQIRKAMIEYGELLKGIIEMDETYIGGKPRKSNEEKNKRGRGTKKIAVVGMVERNGKVKAKQQDKDQLKFKDLQKIVKENIDTLKTTLMTDDYRGYTPISKIIDHRIINHSQKQYTDGDIHTNTIEGFWSLLKRGIVGQYHKVSIKYLNKYIDEFCFKYNHRKNKTVFDLLLNNAVGV